MDANQYGHSTATSQPLYLTCSTVTTPCPQVLGYTMGKTLGSGKFAKVKAAWSPFERRMIAIKIINKCKVDQDDLDKFLPREISLLQKVSHPNIISLFQIVETEYHCFIALELAENGDLLDYLNSRGRIPEEESRCIFYQMCQAVAYCHSLGIAHRDIKLENVFFSKDMEVKLGDFGFAIESKSNLCSTPCGSFCYGAPEIVLSTAPEYNPQLADSWSMGVVLYAMVMGCLPFGDDNQVKNGLSNYHLLPLEGNYTKEFKILVKSLLTVDITSRPLIAEVVTHTWMTTLPCTRPSWEGPCGGKHTIKNCLPKYLHTIDPLDYGTSKVETPYPQFIPEDTPQEIVEATDPNESDIAQPPQLVPSSDVNLPAEIIASSSVEATSNPSNPGWNLSICGDKPSITTCSSLRLASNVSSCDKSSISTGRAVPSVTAGNLVVSASCPIVNTTALPVCGSTSLTSARSLDITSRRIHDSLSSNGRGSISSSSAKQSVTACKLPLSASYLSINASKPLANGNTSLILKSSSDITGRLVSSLKISARENNSLNTVSKLFTGAKCPVVCDSNCATNFKPQDNDSSTPSTMKVSISPSNTSGSAKSTVYASNISATDITPISDPLPISTSSQLASTSNTSTDTPNEATNKHRIARKYRIVPAIRSAGRRLRKFITGSFRQARRSL